MRNDKHATAKELKSAIGQEIYLIPLGNAVKRGVPLSEQIRNTILVSVGSKNYEIQAYGNSTKKYSINGDYNTSNMGYMPFLTKQDALDAIEIDNFNLYMNDKLSFQSDTLSKLTIGDVRAIKEIIKNAEHRA
jgi:hypothetical protein